MGQAGRVTIYLELKQVLDSENDRDHHAMPMEAQSASLVSCQLSGSALRHT
jgi:hypothetical protein